MTLILVFLAMLFVGCVDQNTPVTRIPVKAEVLAVHEDNSPWGCAGTNKKTLVRDERGHLANWCGYWGEPGTQFTAIYEVWHSESSQMMNRLRPM